MWQSVSRAFLWFNLCMLSACGSMQAPQTTALLKQAPAHLSVHTELVSVPFFPQTAEQCGPAALATALGAIGISADPDQLTTEIFVPDRGGSLQIEMLSAARRHGAVSVPLPPDLENLFKEVSAGHPAVVLLNLGLSVYPQWHYAVVIGYDLPSSEVILRSGTTKRQTMPMFTFEHTWTRSGQWAFVAMPPGSWPVNINEATAAQAAADFERNATPTQAERVYRSALERWPQNTILGLGLGNALMAQGNVFGAIEALERAVHQAGNAAAWNNLALAYLKSGDYVKALHTAQQAVRRARASEPAWLDTTQNTLAEVMKSRHLR